MEIVASDLPNMSGVWGLMWFCLHDLGKLSNAVLAEA